MRTQTSLVAPVLLGSVILFAGFVVSDSSVTRDTSTSAAAGASSAPHGPAHGPAPTPAQLAGAERALAAKRSKLETRGPKAFDQPDKAAEFFLEQRFVPGTRSFPAERLFVEDQRLRERERRLDLERASAVANGDEADAPGGITAWDWLGPGNIGGRTRALAIDPTNPLVMYAGGVAGGVWKSVDAGANWNTTDDLMLNLAVTTIVIDPVDSDVIYAGTGEGIYPHPLMLQGLGVFKSVDAGATWSQLSGTVVGVPTGAFHFVNKLVISPNDNDRLYAGTRTGVWRSDDAGVTWTHRLGNPTYLSGPSDSNGSVAGCLDLAIRSDSDPDVLFASFGNLEKDGLFRSTDGGATWLEAVMPSNMGRTTIAIAPSDNDVIYLGMADNGTVNPVGQLVNIYRSLDGGLTYTPQVDMGSLTGPWLYSNLVFATGCFGTETYSQGWYDNALAVDPTDADVVWVGGIDLFRSDDGGVNFEIASYWFFYQDDPWPPYQLHADQHTLVFHPGYDGTTNQTMYVGNDGGLYRTDNALAATSLNDCPSKSVDPLPGIVWQHLNNNYGVTQFYHGDSAAVGDVYVGGAQDNGTSRVTSAVTPDAWDAIFGGDGGYVAIDHSDPDIMYVEYQGLGNMQKSTDGGETFVPTNEDMLGEEGAFIPPFAMDPSDPLVLWTGGHYPWRTTDGAGVWEIVGPDFLDAEVISAIAIAPTDGNVVYLGFTNGYVAKSSDALAPAPTWTVYEDDLWGAWVSSMAVDPVNPDIAYVTYSSYGVDHILRTIDGGGSWFPLDGDIVFGGIPEIPVHWIATRPCNGNQLYAGTELGVFVSDDAGLTWDPANTGLAHTIVECLDWQDCDTLVAFTHGRGAYRTDLAPCLITVVVGGTFGAFGVPTLTTSGLFTGGSLVNINLTKAPANAPTLLWISTQSEPLQALGGTVHANPFAFQFLLIADGSGSIDLQGSWPQGIPAGSQFWLQFLVEDQTVIDGITLSDAIRITTP